MTSFKERNPFTIGVIGSVVLAAVVTTAFYAEELPIIGGGTTYHAEFGEAAGLQADDEVRVAGIKVGEVTDVELAEDRVRVAFRVSDVWLGNRTTAEIKIKTLLGRKFLSLYPTGDAALDPDTPITLDRTVTPYDVTEAFSGLANTVGAIDTGQLAQSFRTLSETFADSPQHVRTALEGLTALSRTISERDEQLAQLLANTRTVATSLAGSGTAFEKLLGDGNLLLTELTHRREAISALLTGARRLGEQLSGLVADNKAQLGPALARLNSVAEILQRHTENLDRGLALAGPYFRQVNNIMGNGRWLDFYLCGLIPENRDPCTPPGFEGTGPR
ncbi:MCE family protein [Amycolatopsis suaedae]|uniref:MCE family protein n=1 Tax=Amycolatopsis suaedae TaxID=2510978 RepID=A0A4Q7JAA1_9PSEU|nr:MCE family protein [Amycolatopsis suaedae]RZQ64730.1 MCE family protein [Amycolatopsis suaedae]